MKSIMTLAASAAIFATSALAGDKENVQVFYDLLSNPGSAEHAEAFTAITTEDWISIGDYSGKTKSRDAFLGQMGGFAELIPDLSWNVEEMLQDGNKIVVRSRATGTPAGPFFGVDGEGRGFDILTIDIHELEDGKIIETYHVEDWAGALQQLSGE